jgi:hypothetical protein
MSEAPGNVLGMFGHALERGQKGVTVTADQMRQVLREFSYLVHAKNHLVREGKWDEVLEAEAKRQSEG